MALNLDQLNKVANLYPVAGAAESRQTWHYEAGADTVAAVAAAGYFNGARSLLNVGDKILVFGSGATVAGLLNVTAVPATGNVTTALLGEGGYRTARGQHTTVAAADTLATGLPSVAGVIAVLDSDPVDGAQHVTATIGNQADAPVAGFDAAAAARRD